MLTKITFFKLLTEKWKHKFKANAVSNGTYLSIE